MAFSKANLYKKQERKAARIAKALAHPARINIIRQLMQGELSFQQLCELHPLNKATISKHLQALRLSGLINFTVCGNNYYYSARTENFPDWMELMISGMNRPDGISKAA